MFWATTESSVFVSTVPVVNSDDVVGPGPWIATGQPDPMVSAEREVFSIL